MDTRAKWYIVAVALAGAGVLGVFTGHLGLGILGIAVGVGIGFYDYLSHKAELDATVAAVVADAKAKNANGVIQDVKDQASKL